MNDTIKENYALYHTLVKEDDEELTQSSECIEGIKNLDIKKKEIIFMLVCEHARYCDDIDLKSMYWNDKLPYGCSKKGKSIVIDFNKLPNALQWVIFRFLKI